ncbi:hypothetical protein A9176_08595 (plasmid) [Leuconostoc garlicum]|uniref:Uncharacterized protein n=1 Tax=Leuconostoc garlicum TaxID=255248 RepID=A0ABM6HVS1_9LACO|nr:hypothetical protein [Lactococcus raffinolactis]AQN80469.1 hypothetical protein A9176_08595 [Leuconostoc garlicum]
MTRITKAQLDNIITDLLLPNYSKLNLRDKADLYAIVGGLIEWGELDKRRRRQLRKLAFEGFDRDLSEELKSILFALIAHYKKTCNYIKLSICGLQTYMLFSYGADVNSATTLKLIYKDIEDQINQEPEVKSEIKHLLNVLLY